MGGYTSKYYRYGVSGIFLLMFARFFLRGERRCRKADSEFWKGHAATLWLGFFLLMFGRGSRKYLIVVGELGFPGAGSLGRQLALGQLGFFWCYIDGVAFSVWAWFAQARYLITRLLFV